MVTGKCRADIVCQRPLGFQIGVSERVDRFVGARFRNPIKPCSPILVQFVHRRHPQRRLHRTAENQRIRRLYAQCELGIEAAYDFVKFIVCGNLRVETRAYRKRNLCKEPVHIARIVVRIIPGGERIGTDLVPATDISRHRTRVRVLIGRIVRRGGHSGPAKLIPDRIRRKPLDQAAAQYGVGHEQLSLVLQIHFLVDPVEQRRAVRKVCGVIGIRRIQVCRRLAVRNTGVHC